MIARVATFLTLLIALSPQTRDQARPSTGPCTISGVVVTDELSPQPVRRARVTLTGPRLIDGASGGAGAAGATIIGALGSTLPDDNGRFTFSSLPTGVYLLDAAKPALVTQVQFGAAGDRQPPAMVTLTDTQPVANVTIKMIKGAAIMGTVRDHEGQVIQGATVRASLVAKGANDRPALVRETTTDDLGRYRLSDLSPGEFLVEATIRVATGATTDLIRA